MSDQHKKSSPTGERAMSEAAALLQYREGDDHVEPIDDLARRRLVDGILDDLERSGNVGGSASTGGTPARWAIGAAAAILLVTAAVLALVMLPLAPGDGEDVSPIARAAPLRGSFLLVQGDTRGHDGARIRVDQPLEQGDAVVTGDGKIVFEFPTGIRAALAPDSSARVKQLNDDGIEIHLDCGEIIAVVDTHRKAPAFSLSTSDGRATVTGTVFSLGTDDAGTRLEVFRGSVEVDGDGLSLREIPASRATRFGEAATEPVSASREDLAAGIRRAVDLMAGDDTVEVRLNSVPGGAAISVDGILVGATPIELMLRPGYRDIDLALFGYSTIKERLTLSSTEKISREFELQPMAKAPIPETGKDLSRKTPRTASDLLRAAQDHRSRRKWRMAASTYSELTRRHPNSPEARNALVSLANVELKHLGRPGRALAGFNKYLQTVGGSLQPEAILGRARSLRALGRLDEERVALETLLARFPSSHPAHAARTRLQELD